MELQLPNTKYQAAVGNCLAQHFHGKKKLFKNQTQECRGTGIKEPTLEENTE